MSSSKSDAASTAGVVTFTVFLGAQVLKILKVEKYR
jgi:hypothetical protein